MAIPKIKSTYSLDVETVEALEQMARRWKVSKSEALRRAIRAAAGQGPEEAAGALRALEALQQSLELSTDGARRWERRTGAERRASSQRLEA
ncbi:MAG: ribbon-helix-helix protein, CopG family [Acidobacteriota bacterium]